MCLGHDDSWITQIRALYWVWGLFIYATIFILEGVCAWGLLISALTTMTMSSQTPRDSISLSSCWMVGVWVFLSTCTECTWKLMTPAPWRLLILLSLIPPAILILRWTRSVRRRSRGSHRRKGPCDTQTASPCRRMRFFITEILMTQRNYVYSLCSLMWERHVWGYVWGYRFTVKVCNSHSWASSTRKRTQGSLFMWTCPYHIAFLQMKASVCGNDVRDWIVS